MRKNISFYVSKTKVDKKGLAPIMAQVTIKNKKYSFMVDKVKPHHWDKKKQRVYKKISRDIPPRHEEINSMLSSLVRDTSRFDRFENYNTAPEIKEVKDVLFNTMPEKKPFNEAYNEFINYSMAQTARNTARSRNTAKGFIDGFQKHYSRTLQFEDITPELFDLLFEYAQVCKLENNGFATYVTKFKAFMKWAEMRGYHNNNEYKKHRFAEKEKEIIALTYEEFKTLYTFDFKNERLEKARDLFCFGCLTGMRYGDIQELHFEHITEDGFIRKTAQKTNDKLEIPLLPEAKRILNKYKNKTYKPLPSLSNQKLNDYIKECCRIAGINDYVEVTKYYGSRKQKEQIEKFNLIKSHTARKTFVTISLERGMPIPYIMDISNHKKFDTFNRRYSQKRSEKKKQWLLNVWSEKPEYNNKYEVTNVMSAIRQIVKGYMKSCNMKIEQLSEYLTLQPDKLKLLLDEGYKPDFKELVTFSMAAGKIKTIDFSNEK